MIRSLAARVVLVFFLTPTAASAELPWAPGAVRRAEQAAQTRELERRLSALPGLAGARVSLGLPEALGAPLDAPEPRPRASLVLWTDAPATGDRPALEATARELAAATVSGLRPEDTRVRWLTTAPPPPPPLVQVGPFETLASSAGWLRATLLGLLATSFVLAALLLRYARRPR